MCFCNNYCRLDSVYNRSKEIEINKSSKIIFFSDIHRGDNSGADNFAPNSKLFISALNYYYSNGFTYIEIGDGDELWENRHFSEIYEAHADSFHTIRKFYLDNRFYMIIGNHDIVKSHKHFLKKNLYKYYNEETEQFEPLFENIKVSEGLILRYSETPYTIFVIHGHQCDMLNDRLWPLARFLVRYVWRPLEIAGLIRSKYPHPISPARNVKKQSIVENKLINWVKQNNQFMITGHTHKTAFPSPGEPPYFNDGCCVYKGYITGIEINNGEIMLVKWSMVPDKNNIKQPHREIIAGPQKLEAFWRQR